MQSCNLGVQATEKTTTHAQTTRNLPSRGKQRGGSGHSTTHATQGPLRVHSELLFQSSYCTKILVVVITTVLGLLQVVFMVGEMNSMLAPLAVWSAVSLAGVTTNCISCGQMTMVAGTVTLVGECERFSLSTKPGRSSKCSAEVLDRQLVSAVLRSSVG